MCDNLQIFMVRLTSEEKRELAKFVVLDTAERYRILQAVKLDPQTSKPLLHAYKIVHALVA